jgi:hypothetical protein
VGEENLLRCEEYGSKQHLHIWGHHYDTHYKMFEKGERGRRGMEI